MNGVFAVADGESIENVALRFCSAGRTFDDARAVLIHFGVDHAGKSDRIVNDLLYGLFREAMLKYDLQFRIVLRPSDISRYDKINWKNHFVI
jgi:hypothetical protein